MKVLIIDQGGYYLSGTLQLLEEGHQVKVWVPNKLLGNSKSLIPLVSSWEPHIRWADLIITTTNDKYMRELTPLFTQGYPVFGCNPEAAELECDRGKGQEICMEAGIDTLPYSTFTSWDDAASYVMKTKGTYVCKPWGGVADKALTYVSKSPKDMLWKLSKWKEKGRLKGQIMLQERVKGIEMAVGGWFGKNGWSQYICENFEHKKFMNEDLGCNTGEQGTVLKYVTQSKLFEETLAPITGHLFRIGYTGYVDQNCIIDKSGKAWPLEFTMRFGYPLYCIQDYLHQSDSAQWKLDLLEGRDTLQVSNKTALGVVLSHGQYPSLKEDESSCGVPIYGVTPDMHDNLKWTSACLGKAPSDSLKDESILCSDGHEIVTVVESAKTIQQASEKAYNICWKLEPPTNLMFRTDIGKRLEKQIPELQKHGYALEFNYD